MASIELKELNGAQTVVSELDSGVKLVFSSGDSHEEDASNVSLTRPNGGVVRSYEKWLKIIVTGLVDDDRLANFQLYMADGAAPAAGVAMQVGLVDGAAVQPVNEDSTAAITDLFSYTSASPLLLTDANIQFGKVGEAGVDSAVADGDQIGKLIVIQMDLTPQAELGVFTTNYGEIPITIRWDVVA